MKELEVGYEDAVAVSADEEAVCVGHVHNGSPFGAVFVAGVEPDVIFDVELPQAFVVLKGEA